MYRISFLENSSSRKFHDEKFLFKSCSNNRDMFANVAKCFQVIAWKASIINFLYLFQLRVGMSTEIWNVKYDIFFQFYSHVGIMHLGFNMMALNSFGPKLVEMLGTEHFIATYLTAAVFSSWTSYVYKV